MAKCGIAKEEGSLKDIRVRDCEKGKQDFKIISFNSYACIYVFLFSSLFELTLNMVSAITFNVTIISFFLLKATIWFDILITL